MGERAGERRRERGRRETEGKAHRERHRERGDTEKTKIMGRDRGVIQETNGRGGEP
jgi:hypothetical protein